MQHWHPSLNVFLAITIIGLTVIILDDSTKRRDFIESDTTVAQAVVSLDGDVVTRVMLVITRLVCRKFRVETKAPKAQP